MHRVAPRPILRYAPLPDDGSALMACLRMLLRPENLLTVIAAWGLVIGSHLLVFFISYGAVPLVLPVLLCVIVLLGHYANVVDDLGPQFLDDVPAVLRDGEWGDDVLRPFRRMAMALGLCLGPAGWLLLQGGFVSALSVPMGMVGMVVLPAVLLTLAEGSTVMNLMPHRLIGMMRAGGRPYVDTVLATGLALLLHGAAGLLLIESLAAMDGVSRFWRTPQPAMAMTGLAYAVLLLALFAGHLAAALLGRTYRQRHERFPWLLQRHERTFPPARLPDGC